MNSLISPLEVYFVLQLDSIRDAFVPILIIGAILSIISFILVAANADADNEYSSSNASYLALGKRMIKPSLGTLIIGILGLTFIPSTKTAATMILLPAITSDKVTEPLSREAGELYQLAKAALKKAVDEDNPTPKQEDNEDVKQEADKQ